MTIRRLGIYELMTAIYSRLTTSALTSTYKFYNKIPETGTIMPYVFYGEGLEKPDPDYAARDIQAEDHVITFHVWSDKNSDIETAQMASNIIQAIDTTPLTITNYNQVYAVADGVTMMIDSTDPIRPVRHGIIRYRFHLEPTILQ